MKKTFLSSFYLKIFALLFMTFDHIGLLLKELYPYNPDVNTIHNLFRGIGRLALPLFVFMIVEGVLHTKSFKKYILRLGVMALFIAFVFIIAIYVPLPYDTTPIRGMGNIFLDLTLSAVAVWALTKKDKKYYIITLLIVVFSAISFSVKCYEYGTTNKVLWFPEFLYFQYDWFSILLAIGYYAGIKLGKVYIDQTAKRQGIDPYVFETSGDLQFAKNLLSIFFLLVVAMLYFSFEYICPKYVFWDAESQLLCMVAGLLILFYNGTRGYNKKWFQYGSYLYYPLSIAALIITYIILG